MSQQHDNLRELADHALAYAMAGFEVHPLEAGGDKPLTRRGAADATADVIKVAAWWRWWPDANIGLRIPWNAVVVESFGDFCEQYITATDREYPLPRTARISGPESTVRWYSNRSVGLRFPAEPIGRLTIRRPGDSIIAPPSRCPARWGDVEYEWTAEDLRSVQPAEMPRWLLDELGGAQNERRPFREIFRWAS